MFVSVSGMAFLPMQPSAGHFVSSFLTASPLSWQYHCGAPAVSALLYDSSALAVFAAAFGVAASFASSCPVSLSLQTAARCPVFPHTVHSLWVCLHSLRTWFEAPVHLLCVPSGAAPEPVPRGFPRFLDCHCGRMPPIPGSAARRILVSCLLMFCCGRADCCRHAIVYVQQFRTDWIPARQYGTNWTPKTR